MAPPKPTKQHTSHVPYMPLPATCPDGREHAASQVHGGSPFAYSTEGTAGSDRSSNVVPGRAFAHRVKKSRVMRWLILHANGTKQQMCLDKRQLIQHFNLDIPTRDMRLMDSTLMGANYGGKDAHTVNPHLHHQGAASSAAQLLVRDNALVMCMEHVRMIITADKVLIPLEEDRSEMNERFNLHIEQVVQEWLAESLSTGAYPAAGSSTASTTQYPHVPPHPESAQPIRLFPPHMHSHLPPLHPSQQHQQSQQQQPQQQQQQGHAQQARRNITSPTLQPQQGQQQQQMATSRPGVTHRRQSSLGAIGAEGQQGRLPSRGPSPVDQHPSSRQGAGHPQGPEPTYAASHDGDSQADGADGLDNGSLLMMGSITPRQGTPSQRGDEELPFELAMLETGLGEACSFLAREADLLQAQSTPALEDLIANSDKSNLERVRRVKTAHQRLLSRVLTVREALHRLMEDDTDMWRMCLTKHASYKALAAAANQAAEQQQQRQNSAVDDIGSPEQANINDLPLLAGSGSVRTPSLLAMKLRQVERAKNVTGDHRLPATPEIAGSPSIDNLDEDDWHDLLDVENLLEAYFTIADSTQTTLAGIGEYIDDTEDLVNINLDNSRNKLIRFEILLTTGTFALSSYSVVAGILGENLVLPELITRDIRGFVFVNCSVLLISTIIFWAIYKALKARKLV